MGTLPLKSYQVRGLEEVCRYASRRLGTCLEEGCLGQGPRPSGNV